MFGKKNVRKTYPTADLTGPLNFSDLKTNSEPQTAQQTASASDAEDPHFGQTFFDNNNKGSVTNSDNSVGTLDSGR